MEKSSRKSPSTPTLIEQHLEELNTYLPSSGCLRSASNFENEVLFLKLDALMIEAETMKDLARHEEKTYGTLKSALLDQEAILYDKMEEGEHSKDELVQELEQLTVRLESFQKETESLNEQIENIQKKYNEAMNKRKKAGTWYYMMIPGYNVYLAIDAQINASSEKLSRLKNRLEEREKEKRSLEEAIEQARQSFLRSQDESSQFGRAITEVKKTILDITDRISESKKSLVAWNNLYMRYGTMKEELNNHITPSKCVMETVEQ